MKKRYLLFLIIGLFALMGSVKAYDYYYYLDDDGNYMLCGGTGACKAAKMGDANTTFDLGNGKIIYQNTTYIYDSVKESEYQKSQAGKSRMYFYKDTMDRYVLCTKVNSCKTYYFDSLKNIASISSNKITMNAKGPGQETLVYIYSQERQDEFDSKHQTKKDESSSSTDTSSQTSTVVEKEEAQPTTDTCTRLKSPLMFIGHMVVIFKIVIPILLIIFGAIDFFRSVTSGKEDELKKSAKSFAFRAIAAVIIFFLPTIVSFIFSFIDSWAGIEGDFNACQKCVFRVGECK